MILNALSSAGSSTRTVKRSAVFETIVLRPSLLLIETRGFFYGLRQISSSGVRELAPAIAMFRPDRELGTDLAEDSFEERRQAARTP